MLASCLPDTGEGMKELVFINGTMGVGKTSTCNELLRILSPSVFLDGDWCWNMSPFVVNDETKAMVLGNIAFMLNSFLRCSLYHYVLFCWVMPCSSLVEEVLGRLDLSDVRFSLFTLTASEEALRKRLQNDIESGKRDGDVLARSLERLPLYGGMDSRKIDVSIKTPREAAEIVAASLGVTASAGGAF